MEKLNFDAKFKFNEVDRVYGPEAMEIYENYIDALLAEGYTGVEFKALQAVMPSMSAMSEITAFAAAHAAQIILENKQADADFSAAKVEAEAEEQAKGTEVMGGTRTKRMMEAAAISIGLTYQVIYRDGKDVHTIGGHEGRTTSELYAKIETIIQRRGDREVLRSATYARGCKCFKIVEKA